MRSALERCSKSGFRPPDPHVSDGHCIYQKKKETQKTEFGCYGIWVLGMLEVACENVVCMLDVCMPDMYA